ncbi:MAG TPA: methyltransferase domain-containing protein [Alphaproteobacteria bacterium]|nr:methyltransferase domain-containing protein [Alphaproteobacteria bacterium]
MPLTDKNSNATLLFLKAWLKSPLRVGAIAPSGEHLGRAMARVVPRRSSLPIVELGGGTGSVTAALLHHVPAERLIVVERDPDLARHLRSRFPGVTVVQGDARHLGQHLKTLGIGPVAAVVSGLPVVAMPKRILRELLDASFEVLEPGAPFIQFTYSLFSPLPRREFGLKGRPVARVLQNVPPASIWIFRKRARSRDDAPERSRQVKAG